jgi:hypothetical protein
MAMAKETVMGTPEENGRILIDIFHRFNRQPGQYLDLDKLNADFAEHGGQDFQSAITWLEEHGFVETKGNPYGTCYLTQEGYWHKGLAEALVGVLDEPLAKKAMLRQMSELESKRDQLEAAAAKAESDKGKPANQLAEDVRAAVAEVCMEITKPISSLRLHAFVEKMIGPIRVNPDGTLTPISLGTPTASEDSEAVAIGNIAGGGFEPPTSGL